MHKLDDYIKTIDGAERRFHTSTIDVEEVEENSVKQKLIRGYAAVFNKDSVDFGGWVERIDNGAFDEVLNDDTFALFNHDPNQVLARNRATLKLTVDNIGLRYEFRPPNTTLGADLAELIRTEVITKSSFAFTVKSHEWITSEDRSKPSIRIIKKLSRLYDVSPVTYPAYPDTTVGTRSFKKELEQKEINYINLIEMQYRISKRKYA